MYRSVHSVTLSSCVYWITLVASAGAGWVASDPTRHSGCGSEMLAQGDLEKT